MSGNEKMKSRLIRWIQQRLYRKMIRNICNVYPDIEGRAVGLLAEGYDIMNKLRFSQGVPLSSITLYDDEIEGIRIQEYIHGEED